MLISLSSSELTPTTNETSATYNGVTFTFNQAMPVGYFVTGEPFVVSSSAFSITAISPAASDIQADGAVGNGAMKNPSYDDTGPQGFDGYLADYPTKTTYEVPYSAAANVDPAISGAISIALGEKATITKSVRRAAKTSNTAAFQTVEKYVHLTVLDAAPLVNAYRPGFAGTTKTIRTRADVDFTPRGYALPGSWPSVASILASVPDDLGFYCGGEVHRFHRLDNALGTTNDGYSGEITPYYARYIYAVNSSNVSEAQRQGIVDRIITFANDIEARIDAGGSVNFGAGQGGGLWLWVVAAAALLKNDTLLQKVRNAAQPDTPFWVPTSYVGRAASGKETVAAQTYFTEHVDMPHVQPDEVGSHQSARYFQIASSIISWEALSILGFSQGPTGKTNGAAIVLNGGANTTANDYAAILGLMARRANWSPNAETSYPTETSWSDAWAQVSAFGDFTPWTGKPDQPPMGNASNLNDDYFTAGDGSITLDTKSIDYATETITQTDMRYSLDGVQWLEDLAITLSGGTYTKTGLLKGVEHWCGWRRHSASGASPWSPNYPYDDYRIIVSGSITGQFIPGETVTGGTSGATAQVIAQSSANKLLCGNFSRYFTIGETVTGARSGATFTTGTYTTTSPARASASSSLSATTPTRSQVTTTGTLANAAPANTVAPKIHSRAYPAWEYPSFTETPATVPVDDVQLACGVGYWSGYPAPNYAAGNFTFQWKRGGVNISGATSQFYTRTAADAGAVLTCEVTCTTAQGSASVTTAGVTCPALTTLPAGTLIDTTFRGAFAVDYESEVASFSGSNYTMSLVPTLSPIDQGENYGAIWYDKTGANPSGTFTLATAAVASTLYDVSGEIAVKGDAFSSRGDFFVEVRDGIGTTLYSFQLDGATVQAGTGNDYVSTFSGQFTTGANTTLSIRVRWNDGTGGASGGDPYLTQLTISEA